MQLVRTNGPVSVNNSSDQPVYALSPNESYVLYDNEVAAAIRAGTVTWIATLDSRLRSYRGQSLTSERLILPFIGRHGDALANAACLEALCNKYAGVSIDIACVPSATEVFQLAPTFGELLSYPLRIDQLEAYDYHLSFEDIASIPNATRRSMFDLFRTCLNTPRPTRPVSLTIPDAATRRCAIPRNHRPLVAVHVGEPASLRSYPIDLTITLANTLCAAGIDVILFGWHASSPIDLSTRLTTQIQNIVGKTKSVADLAATLKQMDLVITGDSFPLHLAAALNVPTVALFAPTASTIASDYTGMTTITSNAKCSPCGVAFGACPIGHATCIAHGDEALSPQRIATQVINLLQETSRTVNSQL